MSAVLNVNLQPCSCVPMGAALRPGGQHHSTCPGAPVLIPCPIPRSVTFTVTLGECTCGGLIWRGTPPAMRHRKVGCPALPIRVACSIGGKMWPDTYVDDAETPNLDALPTQAQMNAASAQRALVKALMLGQESAPMVFGYRQMADLLTQRDTVFAALANMARAEEALYGRQNDAMRAIDGSSLMVPEPDNRPSAHTVARYVKRLISQVGALP